MKILPLLIAAIAALNIPSQIAGKAPDDKWTVVLAKTLYLNARENIMNVSLKKGSQVRAITDTLPIEHIDNTYIVSNELVVIATSGNVHTVALFDINSSSRIDWFQCFYPRLVSDRYIICGEFYPTHTPDDFDDVLLLYDLGKSPIENRAYPGSIDDKYPIRVGIPIFPEANATAKSYSNMVSATDDIHQVMDPPGLLPLSDGSVVFISTVGRQASEYRSSLIKIEFTQNGELGIRATVIPIPFKSLPDPGRSKTYLDAKSMKEVSPCHIEIGLSAADYGVDKLSIRVSSGCPS